MLQYLKNTVQMIEEWIAICLDRKVLSLMQHINLLLPPIMQRLQTLELIISKTSQENNLFSHVELAPPDAILGTRIAYNQDSNNEKINLGVGAYRDDEGNPYVFQIVRKIEVMLLSKHINHEYLEIDGLPQFVSGARNLIMGSESEAVKSQRVASTQTLSGTGAVSLAMDFISQFLPRIIYVSNPTWPIHKGIAQKLGLKWREYSYYDSKSNSFDINGALNCLNQAVSGSFVLLHVCAHNPTGVDPSQQQWKQIAKVMKKNSLIPFFDSAYQGFASGDVEKDAWPVKYFLSEGFQMIVAQSFAKNMGLYGQRVGALHFVASDKSTASKILSQLKIIIRHNYSNPSKYGAEIASQILNNKDFFTEWQVELKDIVAKRIKDVRTSLRSELQRIKTPGSWNHITDQIGMFSYTGLSEKVCEILTKKYHIYLLKSGRISMAGVNKKNVKYLAQSIKAALNDAQK